MQTNLINSNVKVNGNVCDGISSKMVDVSYTDSGKYCISKSGADYLDGFDNIEMINCNHSLFNDVNDYSNPFNIDFYVNDVHYDFDYDVYD